MSSEQTTSQTEIVEQPAKPRAININKKKLIIINEKQSQDGEIGVDKYHKWSDKSKDIAFISTQKCVGNGEEKLAKELDISTPLGGQNSTIDLIHPDMGNISVKDMTNDDCTLGTEGCNDMRKIFRTIINLFVCWILKYRSECELANEFAAFVYSPILSKLPPLL